jgi:hypothetical protein
MTSGPARGTAVLDRPSAEQPTAAPEALIKEARRRQRRRRLTAGAVVLALLGGVLVVVAQDDGGDRPTRGRDTPTPDASRAPGAGRASKPTPVASIADSWDALAPTPATLKDRFFGLGDMPVAIGTDADVFVMPNHTLGLNGRDVGQLVARYTPAHRAWTVFPRGPIAQRVSAITVWTGQELLVWGGARESGEILRDGAALNPATGQWRMLAAAPVGVTNATAAVWTGKEVIVWGGAGGYAYQPVANTWRQLPDAPIANRPYPSAVWTGTEMVVWGGCAPDPPSNPGPCDAYTGSEPTDGAAYDPTLDSWRRIAPSPLPPRPRPHAVWTGTEVIVWGGVVGPAPDDEVGASYDPTSDTWRPLPPAPFPSPNDFSLFWTGTAMLAVGNGSGNAVYDPRDARWAFLPAPPFAWISAASAWIDDGLVGIGGSMSDWRGALLRQSWGARRQRTRPTTLVKPSERPDSVRIRAASPDCSGAVPSHAAPTSHQRYQSSHPCGCMSASSTSTTPLISQCLRHQRSLRNVK